MHTKLGPMRFTLVGLPIALLLTFAMRKGSAAEPPVPPAAPAPAAPAATGATAAPPAAADAPKPAADDSKDAAKPAADDSKDAAKAPAAPAGPTTVAVGLYLNSVPDVDIRSNQYMADFYLWFRWKGEVDPTQSFELTNAVELSELTKVPVYADATGNPVADTLPDGTKYQVFHVHGHFRHAFPVNKYPFDEQDITVDIEDSKHSLDELKYEADAAATGSDNKLEIPGWAITSARAKVTVSNFATNFGDPRVTAGSDNYSHFQFSLHVERPVMSLFGKLVVPMGIVVLITLMSLFIHPESLDARLSLTITALLSVVALQFTAAAELPSVGYMTLLDKIYLLTYFIVFAATGITVWGYSLTLKDQLARAIRIDKGSTFILLTAFFGGVALIVLLR